MGRPLQLASPAPEFRRKAQPVGRAEVPGHRIEFVLQNNAFARFHGTDPSTPPWTKAVHPPPLLKIIPALRSPLCAP